MVETSGGNIAKVANELKIHDSSLGNWVRQARVGAPSTEERSEIRDLRRDPDRVTRVRDILAEAVASLAPISRAGVIRTLLCCLRTLRPLWLSVVIFFDFNGCSIAQSGVKTTTPGSPREQALRLGWLAYLESRCDVSQR
jgi:hypothetical protein